MFGLLPKPFGWEKKAAQLSAGIKAGQIEELRAHPIKGAITVVSFAAMPPIFKGIGAVWKGIGLSTKLPRITNLAPKIILGGMGASYAGWVGYETYKAPTLEKKGEVLGRTSVELTEMGLGAGLGIGGIKAAKYISSYTKSKVFPFESLDILIADTSAMARLRRKWALEQAEREAKILRGEYKARETSTGIVIEEVKPLYRGGMKRTTRRESSMQRRTTTRTKEREAERLAKRKAKRRAELGKKIREKQEQEIITPLLKSSEKVFAEMKHKLSTGQGIKDLLIARIGYTPLAVTLHTQRTEQFITPITRTRQKELSKVITKEQYGTRQKQISKTITEQKYITKQKEKAKEVILEEAITNQLQKQLLLLKQIPTLLIKQEKILLKDARMKQMQEMDIKTITEKIKAIEPIWFEKSPFPKYKLPLPPSEIQAIPLISLPNMKKKRPKRKKHIKESPYEWFERHPMPTLRTLFGSGITQKTGMAIMTQLIGETPKKKPSAKKKPLVSKRKHRAKKPSSIPVSGVGMMMQLIGEMPKR